MGMDGWMEWNGFCIAADLLSPDALCPVMLMVMDVWLERDRNWIAIELLALDPLFPSIPNWMEDLERTTGAFSTALQRAHVSLIFLVCIIQLHQ